VRYEIDCLVIGAGVVGLAVARELQLAGREVFLVERERSFGMGTSSRNSEVIHAGIYYEPGSLKATLCVRGKELLYEYCQKRSIPHKRIGKLIVAVNDSEIGTLEKYKATAEANGVHDLQWLDRARIRALEPNVVARCGLFSPSTGIIDSHSYMQALLNDFEAAGGSFVRNTPVLRGAVSARGIEINLGDSEKTVVSANCVVNSAGLHAPEVAQSIEGISKVAIPSPYYAVGHYFSLNGVSPFRHLVYPIATAGGLGIHVTLDMSGMARFGPDISWREKIDYTFDAGRKEGFERAIRVYFPGLRTQDMRQGYTGIRPKISGPGEPNRDFEIQAASPHAIKGLINLFGIESPGLTASMAIAKHVYESLTLN